MAAHLTSVERDRIAQLIARQQSPEEIAKALGRNPSTIYRELKRNATYDEYLPYAAEEIGHFRAFCELHLMRSKHGIDSILFGATDKSDRMRDDIPAGQKQMTPGIAAGIGGGQWEELLASESETEDDGSEQDDGGEELVPEYKRVGSSSGVGMNEVKLVSIEYRKEPVIRREAAITLRDLDESLFLARLNRGLAEKVNRIHVYGNEYKLLEMSKDDFVLDDGLRSSKIPVDFRRPSFVILGSTSVQRAPLFSTFAFQRKPRTVSLLLAKPRTAFELRRRRNRIL